MKISTFYVLFRDHNCDMTSEIRSVSVSDGASYNIDDLTCPWKTPKFSLTD